VGEGGIANCRFEGLAVGEGEAGVRDEGASSRSVIKGQRLEIDETGTALQSFRGGTRALKSKSLRVAREKVCGQVSVHPPYMYQSIRNGNRPFKLHFTPCLETKILSTGSRPWRGYARYG